MVSTQNDLQLTLFAEDTRDRASRSQPPGSNSEKKTRVTSGRKCVESFEKHAPVGSFARMFADTFDLASTPLPHNWKMTASPSGRLLFQLALSVPRIDATGSGLWQTPVADDSIARSRGKWNGRGEPKLSAQVKLWPTPSASLPNDGEAPNTWLERRERVREKHNNGNGMGMPLAIAAKVWPTPAARDYRSPNKLSYAERGGGKKGEQLPNAVGGQLNPSWVEALMGYASDWTSLSDGPTEAGKQDCPALPLASPIE
jgi:hypothetical protein